MQSSKQKNAISESTIDVSILSDREPRNKNEEDKWIENFWEIAILEIKNHTFVIFRKMANWLALPSDSIRAVSRQPGYRPGDS